MRLDLIQFRAVMDYQTKLRGVQEGYNYQLYGKWWNDQEDTRNVLLASGCDDMIMDSKESIFRRMEFGVG
jgi:hypothetical protein